MARTIDSWWDGKEVAASRIGVVEFRRASRMVASMSGRSLLVNESVSLHFLKARLVVADV